MEVMIVTTIAVLFILFIIFSLGVSRYKKCPSDKIMVIYGKIGKDNEGNISSAKCIHGGAAFIWPVIQHCEYLDLTPFSIEVNLKNALSRQNIRVDIPSRFTVGISTEDGVMQNAAERLLGLNLTHIQELAKDIIFGQLRLVIATMNIEEINSDRDKFLINVSKNVEAELKKIGLKLINVNITDIKDESGYIDALGKEAASKAINEAKVKVSINDKEGAVGEANSKMEERIKIADSNAFAIEGENKSKIQIANSDATRREKEAEATKRAIVAEKIQHAKSLEESYLAEQSAEKARAQREKATKEADIVVQAEISKRKLEIETEAEALKNTISAKGKADALREESKGHADSVKLKSIGEQEAILNIAKAEAEAKLLKMQAEAQGNLEILTKQAEGFDKLVKSSANDPKAAVLLMIAEKLPDIIKTQVEAIKNIKIDKVTVWESGSNKNGEGNSTSSFISNLYKSLPPLNDVFNQAGLNLPDYLLKDDKTKNKSKFEEIDNRIENIEIINDEINDLIKNKNLKKK
jgi:flotillin